MVERHAPDEYIPAVNNKLPIVVPIAASRLPKSIASSRSARRTARTIQAFDNYCNMFSLVTRLLDSHFVAKTYQAPSTLDIHQGRL